MNTALRALAGLTVAVTRPQHQAANLAHLLQEAGASVLLFPTIAIRPHTQLTALSTLCSTMAENSLCIFVSQNAVRSLSTDPALRLALRRMQIAAIGQKTAELLATYDLPPHYVPMQGFTSEHLLKTLSAENLVGRSVYIIKGEGGRDVLATTLREYGANVTEIATYERVLPTVTEPILLQQSTWQRVGIICINSGESLTNLIDLLKAAPWLYEIPVLLGSERIAEQAIGYGFKHCVLASDPSDAAMLNALMNWKENN